MDKTTPEPRKTPPIEERAWRSIFNRKYMRYKRLSDESIARVLANGTHRQ